MKPWRLVSVKKSRLHGSQFVAEIFEGNTWVARVKSPNGDATEAETRAIAEMVVAAVNGAREGA